MKSDSSTHDHILRTATHETKYHHTLQQAALHCNELHYTALDAMQITTSCTSCTSCKLHHTSTHTATHINTHCNTHQHTLNIATQCNTRQHTATHSNNAGHCNTPPNKTSPNGFEANGLFFSLASPLLCIGCNDAKLPPVCECVCACVCVCVCVCVHIYTWYDTVHTLHRSQDAPPFRASQCACVCVCLCAYCAWTPVCLPLVKFSKIGSAVNSPGNFNSNDFSEFRP